MPGAGSAWSRLPITSGSFRQAKNTAELAGKTVPKQAERLWAEFPAAGRGRQRPVGRIGGSDPRLEPSYKVTAPSLKRPCAADCGAAVFNPSESCTLRGWDRMGSY